jgi:hypothetical protein
VATQAAFLFVYAVTSAAIPQAMPVQQSERDHWDPQPFTTCTTDDGRAAAIEP